MNWESLLQWLESLVKADTYLIYQLLFWIGVLVLVMVYYFIEKISYIVRKIRNTRAHNYTDRHCSYQCENQAYNE
jgi:hypothetical protein